MMRNTAVKILLGLLLIVAAAMPLRAQTDPQLTHYYEVPSFHNPAAIGQTDFIRIRGGARLQWVGVENAPVTFLATANTPFKFMGRRWGVGAVVMTESIGLYKTISASLQLGYKFKALKGEWTVALQPGFFNEAFKGSDVFIPDDDDYHQSTDEAIPTNDVAGNAFDLGVGIWYQNPRLWGGISLQHAMSPTVKFSNSQSGGAASDTGTEHEYSFQARRTLYFMVGGNIPIKNTLFEVMPSMIYRNDFSFWNAEATARVRYNKFLTAGVGYRWDDAVTAMLAVEIKGFYLGYSFDWSTGAIGSASSGSHEIFAGYNLKLNLGEKNRNKHKSVRLM